MCELKRLEVYIILYDDWRTDLWKVPVVKKIGG